MIKIWIDKPKKVGNHWRIRFRNSETGFKPKYETWPVDEYSETFVKDRVKDLKALVRLNKFDPWKEEKSTTSDLLISEAIRLFLSHYKKEVSDRTYDATKTVLNQFREEFCGKKRDESVSDYKLKTVTSDDIDKYIRKHTNTPQSSDTYLSPFRSMFTFLQDEGLIDHYPKLKTYDKRKQKNKLPDIIKESELWELYEYAMNEYIQDGYVKEHKQKTDVASWIVYFYTGLRTEELSHLKPMDIDLDGCRGRIGFHKSTKTYMNRIIWIPEECHDAFRFLMEGRERNEFLIDHARSTNRRKMGSSYHLFTTCMKKVFPGNNMPLYNLRHSAGCWMLEQGLSIMFVKEQLGHKKLDQVLTYARLTGTAFEKELSRIGRKFADSNKSVPEINNLRPYSGQKHLTQSLKSAFK